LFRSGIPRAFGPELENLIVKGKVPVFGLRLLLTVLYSTRAIKDSPNPDINAIIDPSNRCVSTLAIDFRATEF